MHRHIKESCRDRQRQTDKGARKTRGERQTQRRYQTLRETETQTQNTDEEVEIVTECQGQKRQILEC